MELAEFPDRIRGIFNAELEGKINAIVGRGTAKALCHLIPVYRRLGVKASITTEQMQLIITHMQKQEWESIQGRAFDFVKSQARTDALFDSPDEKTQELVEATRARALSTAKYAARNAIANASAEHTAQLWGTAGLDYYEWSASSDERVRATHKAVDGKICKIYDPTVYRVGSSWEMRTSRMAHLNPGEDYNCRCVALPVDEEITGGPLREVVDAYAQLPTPSMIFSGIEHPLAADVIREWREAEPDGGYLDWLQYAKWVESDLPQAAQAAMLASAPSKVLPYYDGDAYTKGGRSKLGFINLGLQCSASNSRGAFATYFHEAGHVLAHKTWRSTGHPDIEKWATALQRDYAEPSRILRNAFATVFPNTKAQVLHKFTNGRLPHDELYMSLIRMWRVTAPSDLRDIQPSAIIRYISAFTDGASAFTKLPKFKKLMMGHSIDYWSKRAIELKPKYGTLSKYITPLDELFATMFSILIRSNRYDPVHSRIARIQASFLQKLLPNITQEFSKYMNSLFPGLEFRLESSI
jgi:SPP1 gp7 family putative phage head morphogenesis protein